MARKQTLTLSLTKIDIACLWVTLCLCINVIPNAAAARHQVVREHPRLLGSRERLQTVARQRQEAYERMVRVAQHQKANDHAKMISMALVCAIETDAELGNRAVQMAMKYVNSSVRKGHTPFAHDLARCAVVYDLCHEYWTGQQRAEFHQYVNKTVDANVRSETHVFHNGWYGYKHWGIGLACYASYYENPRAPAILDALEKEYCTRAAPALELAGDGGGWAEGYYVNYWLYEWLFFCEVARYCEGVDYYAAAPGFFKNRAIASMFEAYPGLKIYNSRRPIPMGDGGGRKFGGDRDKVLSARRILVNYFRDDPDHKVVHAFNETTPHSAVGVYAYKDFLWRDPTVEKGDLENFRLSHYSPGPGYVYARSSWDENATYFFFKCGDRFTAHQHLDVGHFLIYKHEELVGDGGHYDSFGSEHDVNYHLRTIAHSTILVRDSSEKWPGIRAGNVTGNDGGQHHCWPHHNGAVTDADAWHKGAELYDIADILAFEDRGDYVYVAGDCTRAYSPKKLEYFRRQIVFLRPDTFVIFDLVRSKNAQFKKTWLLQAVKKPTKAGRDLVVTNGEGRLFVQTLLPRNPHVELVNGDRLYSYGGKNYPPSRNTDPAPECRIEVSPSQPAAVDYFLHVLTATDDDVDSVDRAQAQVDNGRIVVNVGDANVTFLADEVGGRISLSGDRRVGLAPPTSIGGASPTLRDRFERISDLFKPPAELANDFGDYKPPLIFNDGTIVKTPADWSRRRREIIETWESYIGSWPPLIEKPEVQHLSSKRRENFTQHKVTVEIAPDRQTVDGYILVPDGKGPFPAVLVVYYDAETGIGLGREGRDFALQLTRRGFVTMSIGTPEFCSLKAPYKPLCDTRFQPLSALAYVAANCHTALASIKQVDSERIGVVGHSYGGKWAMFASCLYEKFACSAWSDPGIVFDETRANVNYWEPWYLGYESGRQRPRGVPSEKKPRTGAYKDLVREGHDLHELHALTAPRPFLVSGGAEDRPERWKALNHTIAVNKLLGHEKRVAMSNRKGHGPTPESNEQIYTFFEHFLKASD
jgi:dienelactone hydrolase